jgi:hypothetical protein
MSDIGSGIGDVPSHLAHDTDVFVAVEKRVLVISARRRPGAMRSPVRL